ncbi:MAG: hypothetical protein HYY04_13345 [Chloroflexi bacterium]|nr:hypothetical protein [Chloroflexota bacterium]
MMRRLTSVQVALLVAIGILLAASALFGWDYVESLRERSRLQLQLRALQQSIERLQAPVATPVISEPAFPRTPPTVDLMDGVLRAAAASGLQATDMHASTLGAEQIGSNTYRAARLSLQLRGAPEQLQAFFARLESSAPRTLVVDRIEFLRAGAQVDVALELVVYAQPG